MDLNSSKKVQPALLRIHYGNLLRSLEWVVSFLFNLLEHPTGCILSIKSVDQYIYSITVPGFMSANNRANCRPSRRVQWCVTSNLEDRKCRWLREASFVYGVEPTISCKQESSRSACLVALKDNKADVFVARPEELYDARLWAKHAAYMRKRWPSNYLKYRFRMGLKSLVQAIPKKNNEFNRIAAIVKRDSWFRSFRDLRGARACFTGYKDVGKDNRAPVYFLPFLMVLFCSHLCYF